MVLCVKMTDDELSKSGDIPRGPQCPRRSYTAGRGSETRHNTTQVVIFPWAVGAKHSRLSRASVYRHVASVICGPYKVCNRQVLSGPNMPVRSDVCPPPWNTRRREAEGTTYGCRCCPPQSTTGTCTCSSSGTGTCSIRSREHPLTRSFLWRAEQTTGASSFQIFLRSSHLLLIVGHHQRTPQYRSHELHCLRFPLRPFGHYPKAARGDPHARAQRWQQDSHGTVSTLPSLPQLSLV